MRVLIAGAGEVGFRVGRDLVYRGHEVTLVDSNPSSVKRAQTLDAQVFKGNAASAKFLLEEASIKDADLFIGVTGKDVVMLKEKYPGVPVVSYVNTSADVKAETDVCCTSANAVKVVESLGVDKVIFLPDHYLANYVQKNTKVKIISWQGTCIVHEKFTAREIEDIRKQNPEIQVIAHPECPPDVISASDFAGST